MKGVEILKLDIQTDDRGSLVKILKNEYLGGKVIGEIYLTTTAPGIIRANHFHRETTEWFCVVKGNARIYLTDIASGDKRNIAVSDKSVVLVCVPACVAHAVENTGSDTMYMIAIADRGYDAADPDTIPFKVSP